MMNKRDTLLLAILSTSFLAATSEAAIWTVAKDGSGDFTVIQDAINAAAAGDTIRVGPGRYEEFHTFQLPGGATEAHARAEQAELTIIGAGSDTTIIGPMYGPGTQFSPRGIMSGPGTRLQVNSLTVENTSNGVEANGPFVSLEQCVLRTNRHGLDTVGWEGTEVRDCIFIGSTDAGIVVFQGLGATNVLIEDCRFLAGVTGVDLQSDAGLVTGCTFDGPTVGLQISFGGEALINDCTFRNNLNVGIGLVGGSTATVTNCTLETSAINVFVTNGSHLAGTQNTLAGGSLATLSLLLSTTVDFHGNHILNTGALSVELASSSSSPVTFDLTNNYWGTSDSDQIADWIEDGNDDPDINGVVIYEPFFGQPIGAETSSFGRLKALFADDH